MTLATETLHPVDSPLTPPAAKPAWKRLLSAGQFFLALAITVAFLAYLVFVPAAPQDSSGNERPAEIVSVVGPGRIRVQEGSSLARKIQAVVVRTEKISDPVMLVTGRVAASLRPGKEKGHDYWQFDTPEVLTAYSDWQKGQADIAFAETQLAAVKSLASARLDAQKRVVARLEKGVSGGSDTEKDLAAEKANLLQSEITVKKEQHEAETALRVARRTEATSAKQLQQAGLDPEQLRSATSDVDIVMADVPEGRLNRVRIGQGCQAVFYGFPDEKFAGKVNSIAPVLSKERRTLRVLFVIDDLKDQLRPGMFAEIGMGTDPRPALLVPADSVLHVGRADYVLVAAEANVWRVAEVQVGEPHRGDVQILTGLKEGERVIGSGAILFKPLVVRSLQVTTETNAEGRP